MLKAICLAVFSHLYILKVAALTLLLDVNTLNVVILLSRYILSIEKAEEIEEYVGDLLQGTDGRKGHFINELILS